MASTAPTDDHTAAALRGDKRCPGWADQGVHSVPADKEHWHNSLSTKDGLSIRCKTCGNAKAKAWQDARKLQEPATGDPTEPATPPSAGGFEAERRVVGSGTINMATGAITPDAPQGIEGLPEGYTTEIVGGIAYPMPGDKVLGTPEGQHALEVLNTARAADRKRRDAARKRDERARKKAAEQA